MAKLSKDEIEKILFNTLKEKTDIELKESEKVMVEYYENSNVEGLLDEMIKISNNALVKTLAEVLDKIINE